MTSQIDNDSMTKLKAEAKELGVKGIHFFKTEEHWGTDQGKLTR